uniref:Uncharacterized protein n=1 Tax=Rhizophora mucronata TaxID=61149 RepID=A0A2P2PKV8_RHIMU
MRLLKLLLFLDLVLNVTLIFSYWNFLTER